MMENDIDSFITTIIFTNNSNIFIVSNLIVLYMWTKC